MTYTLEVYAEGRWIIALEHASYQDVLNESLEFTRFKIKQEDK